MITVAVKDVGQGQYAAVCGHAREQILIFAALGPFIITTHLIKHFATKHCRAMWKRNVSGTAHQSPTITRPHFPAAGVNAIAKRSHNRNIRTALDNVTLPFQALGMSNVVSIHARHNWSLRSGHYRIRAAGESVPLLAFVEAYAVIPVRPFSQ